MVTSEVSCSQDLDALKTLQSQKVLVTCNNDISPTYLCCLENNIIRSMFLDDPQISLWIYHLRDHGDFPQIHPSSTIRESELEIEHAVELLQDIRRGDRCTSFDLHLRWISRSLPSQKRADTRTLVSRTTRINSFFFFPDLIDRPLDIVLRDALRLGILSTPSQEALELLLRGHADPL